MKFFLQTLLSACIAIAIMLGMASLSDMIADESQINRAVSPANHVLLPIALESGTLQELVDGQGAWTKASAMKVDRHGRCWLFIQAETFDSQSHEARIYVIRRGLFFQVTLPENFRELGLGWKPVDMIPVAGQYVAVTELCIGT